MYAKTIGQAVDGEKGHGTETGEAAAEENRQDEATDAQAIALSETLRR